jgi:hypothetical protein
MSSYRQPSVFPAASRESTSSQTGTASSSSSSFWPVSRQAADLTLTSAELAGLDQS